MTFWFFFNSAQRRSNKARLQQRLAKERGTVWWTYLSIFSGWGVASKKLGSFIKRPKVDGKDKETLVCKRETGKKRVYIWRVVHGADFFVRPSCVAVCRLWSCSRTGCRTIRRSTPQSLAISFVMPKVIGQRALCAVGCLIDRLSPLSGVPGGRNLSMQYWVFASYSITKLGRQLSPKICTCTQAEKK
jgi:hypothetical protein